MNQVFADTAYWIALLDPGDDLHDRAVTAEASLGQCPLVTTEEVLTEFFNYFSDFGSRSRQAVWEASESLFRNPRVHIPAPRLTIRFAPASAATTAAPTSPTASPTASP